MTSATTDDHKLNTSASGQIHSGFSDLPTEIVRLVFEASVTPSSGSRADDDQQRQRSAYAYCLVSKEVKAWVEPKLYEKAVLESRSQVVAFLDTLESKSTEFLTRIVKTVWILVNSLPDDALVRFHLLFIKCLSLERIACLGGDPCNWILKNICTLQNGSRTLRELTIIRPSPRAALFFDLLHNSVQRLQIIDSEIDFIDVLYAQANRRKTILDALRAIPHIFLDFTVIPNITYDSWLRSNFIPLLIRESPGSNSILCIRSSSTMAADPKARRRSTRYKNVKSWVEAFDTDVQQCGGRLTVYTKFITEASSNPYASYIERSKPWIGLDE